MVPFPEQPLALVLMLEHVAAPKATDATQHATRPRTILSLCKNALNNLY